MNRVGVLALQGDFAAHVRALARAGAGAIEVRRAHELRDLGGLVLPGGESTTLLNLMQGEPWFDELRRLHARGGAMLATCAGAILLAREVTDPEQDSVGLLDAVVQRNGWGRQSDSFEADLQFAGDDEPLHAIFIRAPRFRGLGPAVEVLARFQDEPVLVRQEGILAATFHPELSGEGRLHRLFVERVESEPAAAQARGR